MKPDFGFRDRLRPLSRKEVLKLTKMGFETAAVVGLGTAAISLTDLLRKLLLRPSQSEAISNKFEAPVFKILGGRSEAVELIFDGFPPSSSLLVFDFAPEARLSLKDRVEKMAIGQDYPDSPPGLLLKADPQLLSKLTLIWEKNGSPAGITQNVFYGWLGDVSPQAKAIWDELSKGPELQLPTPTGQEKLNILVPKDEWIKYFQVFCVSPAKWQADFFTPFDNPQKGSDGKYQGEFVLDYIRGRNGEFDISNCPVGASIKAIDKDRSIVLANWSN